MPTIDPCTIKFDNPAATYRPGDLLSGSLLLGFHEPVKVRKIFVQVLGYCTVSFTTGHGEHRRSHHQSEMYIKHVIIVYGNERSVETVHPAGPAKYRFQMTLPNNLPPSFQGGHGNITYYCGATLDMPWAFDKEIKVPFVVTRTIDLNMEGPAVKLPRLKEYTGSAGCCFGLCCCSWGTVKSTLQLHRGGYVPGEAVHFIADVANRSSKICNVEVSLIQIVTFRARGYTKVVTNPYATIQKQIPNETDDVIQDRLVLPPNLNPLRIDNCALISVRYVIQMQSVITFGLILTLEEELILGHVPLNNSERHH